jgi:hypothetical protein
LRNNFSTGRCRGLDTKGKGGEAGHPDAFCGHGVRVGVESGTRGKVSFPIGLVMCPTDLQRYKRLLLARKPGYRQLGYAFEANVKMFRGADWLVGDDT